MKHSPFVNPETQPAKDQKNLSITAPFSIKLLVILFVSLLLGYFAIRAMEYQTNMTLRRSFSDNYARFLAGQMSRLIGNYPDPLLWEKEGEFLSIELKKRAPVSGLSGILIINKTGDILGRIPAESICQKSTSEGSSDLLVNNEVLGHIEVCLEDSVSGLTNESLSLLNIGTLTSRIGADYSRLIASQIELAIDQIGDPDYWEYSPEAISYALSGVMPLKGVTSVSVFNKKGEFVALEYLNDTELKPSISAQSGLTYKGQSVGQVIVDIDFPEIRDVENSFIRYLLVGLAIIVLSLFTFPVAIVRRLERSVRKAYTDLQKSHTDLEEAQLKLINSAKMAAIGTMAGGIAHEINNPLVIIVGHADILYSMEKTKPSDGEEIRLRSKKILDTAFRIAKIVKSLKSLAREGERDPFEITAVASIVDETLEICAERARNFGIQFKIQEIPASSYIECQPIQISQVILNLLNNACDALQEAPVKWIRLDFKEENQTVEISITDSGTGIPKEVQSTLFRPFFTTKSAGKGTGLGLSISRQIIESHGGTIELDALCPSTRFIIRLPKSQNGTLGSSVKTAI